MSKLLEDGLGETSLPINWVISRIGDLLRVRNGYAFKSSDYASDGVSLIRQAELTGKHVSLDKAVKLPRDFLIEFDNYAVQKNDMLVGMSGSLGKISLYRFNEPALQNQRTGLLMVFEEKLKSYIYYYFEIIASTLQNKGKGIAVQNISAKDIESIEIPLPPLNEQKRIVEKLEQLLSELDKAVDALKAAQQKLKTYRRAVLKAAVEGELSRAWREENRERLEPADKLLERILAERRRKWEVAELEKMRAKGKEPIDDK